jgi:hypothetical protein
MAHGELTPQGPGFWLHNFLRILMFAMVITVPPVVGYKNFRQTWAICWLWVGGVIMSLIYLPALAVAAGLAFGWIKAAPLAPGLPPETSFFRYLAFGILLICMPLYYNIYRMLTMRYFQPWTTPDQWEKEAYVAPAWAKAIARNSAYLILLILILRGCATMMGGHGR